jgi:hypothetical protein
MSGLSRPDGRKRRDADGPFSKRRYWTLNPIERFTHNRRGSRMSRAPGERLATRSPDYMIGKSPGCQSSITVRAPASAHGGYDALPAAGLRRPRGSVLPRSLAAR